jgi:hypothetical protein
MQEQPNAHLAAPVANAAPESPLMRLLTADECDAVMNMTAHSTYADYANVQRTFCDANHIQAVLLSHAELLEALKEAFEYVPAFARPVLRRKVATAISNAEKLS